jgi:hypothetical protein
MSRPQGLAALLLLLATPCGARRLATPTERRAQQPPPRGVTAVPNGVRHLVASATSGALGATALAPLEIIRVNLLLNSGGTLKTAVDSLAAGWFRGNTADVLAAAARVGIVMPAFAQYKRLLQRGLCTLRGEEASAGARLPQWAVFSAGALAGCTASIACYPLEMARTRMAVSCDVRLGLLGCILGTLREGGVLRVYSGLLTTLAGVIPFNAIKLTGYDLMRAEAVRYRAAATGADVSPYPYSASQTHACFSHATAPQTFPFSLALKKGRRSFLSVWWQADAVSLPVHIIAALGAISGVVAATSCFPLEVVRRRQMAGELIGLNPLAAISTVRSLWTRLDVT